MVKRARSLQSPLLARGAFRHAFFTRRGGVSCGPYESLNFSVGSGDSRSNVDDNFARASAVLGVPRGRVLCLSQVHGTLVRVVDDSSEPDATVALEGDAMAARAGQLGCGVRIADCAPILVGDRASGAVAAVHAGWRGTEAGIVQAAVDALRALVGARGDLVSAIGPHISVDAFEVGEEVAARLERCSSADGAVRRDLGPKPHVDLRRILRAQLRDAGLGDDAIDDVPGCTVREPELFFSYRRDGPKSGRHLAAIVPRG